LNYYNRKYFHPDSIKNESFTSVGGHMESREEARRLSKSPALRTRNLGQPNAIKSRKERESGGEVKVQLKV